MKLQEQTKSHLQDLIRKYQNKKMDLNFCYEGIGIINEAERFANKIILQEVNSIPTAEISVKTMEIKINPHSIADCIEKIIYYRVKHKPLDYQVGIYNKNYAFILFHEIGHFIQLQKAMGKIKSPEIIQKINQIWRSYFCENLEEQKKFVFASAYKEYHDFLYMEREANLFSIALLYDLLEDEKIKKECGISLLENWKIGYINRGPFANSPVEYTLDLLNEKIDFFNTKEFSFIDKLNIGLPLNEEEMYTLSKIILEYCQDKIELDKAITRIRKKNLND